MEYDARGEYLGHEACARLFLYPSSLQLSLIRSHLDTTTPSRGEEEQLFKFLG